MEMAWTFPKTVRKLVWPEHNEQGDGQVGDRMEQDYTGPYRPE